MKYMTSVILKRNIILLFMAIIPCIVSSQKKVKLMIIGSVVIDDDKVAGTIVSIEKNNAPFKKMSINETGKFAVSVEYQEEYIFSFEKKGYITKKISISTKIPKNVLDEGYEPITFKISLFKQYEGVNTVIFNQPVGRYAYDDKKDEFTYDMDYTKTIQSEIAKVEAEVQVKKEEEKEQKKQQVIAENNNKKNTNTNIKNIPSQTEDENNKNKARAKQEKEDDINKKAKASADEEWKKKLNPKKYNDFRSESEEDKQKKKELEKAKLQAKVDEENQKRLEAKAKEEEFARLYKEAKSKGEEEMRKLLSDSRMKSFLASIYQVGITIEITKDPKKEVKRVIVNRDGMCNVYSEVKHSWGGKYYFKNSETISQLVFNKETKPLANEQIFNKSE